MIVLEHKGETEVVVIGIQPGEMLLETIRKAIEEKGVRNGAVVSGIGTLKTCTMHYINHTDFPPSNTFWTMEKPLELLSVSGVIADGEPHLHIVVSCKDEAVYAGHLEPDSEVLYLAEIVILRFDGLALTRKLDEVRKVKLLGPKE